MAGRRGSAVWPLLRLEWLLTVRNRQVLPLFVLFPLIGLALPSLLVLSASKLLAKAATGNDALLGGLMTMVKSLATIGEIDLTEAMRQILLRVSASYYVMMPGIMVPITAAFAVVGERQRRTLEPLLATPLGDLEFCLGKLGACLIPAVLATWVAAAGGAVVAALVVHADHGVWMWPDQLWWLAVLLLTPVLALAVALVCLAVSIRAGDSQSASQTSALVVMPVLLLGMSLAGPVLVMSPLAVVVAALILLAVDVLLLYAVARMFRRTGVLGSG